MQAIFLDIDGVLNSEEFNHKSVNTDTPYPLDSFDPLCVERLNNILETTEAKLVISSDWRFIKGLDLILHNVGIKYPIYSTTPYIGPFERGKEIEQWLKNHSECDNYVILDDNDFYNKEQHKHFVHTDYRVGLTDDDTIKAITILT